LAQDFSSGKGRVVQRRTDMRAQAARLQAQTGSGIVIPADVYSAMEQQGMDMRDPWSPGNPMPPMMPLDQDPRQYEYVIGQNIMSLPRQYEAVSFNTMRGLIDNYDVVQLCISTRQDELRNLEWDIVPYDESNLKTYSSEIRTLRKFFEKPDGVTLYDDWMNAHSYDLFAYDAPALYVHRTRNGKLGALECKDGTTFAPLLDYWGRLPEPPAPAYVQWINGMPFWWGTKDNIIYRPFRRKNNRLYGTPAIEWLLMTINTDVRLQWHFLLYFTDGNLPDTFVNAPDGVTDPKIIKEIQTMYNTVMTGDQSQKHRVKFLPFGSNVHQIKESKFDTAFAQWLMMKVCSSYGVQPAEIGLTEKVNKSSGETQENVTYRRAIKPIAKYYEALFTHIIHKEFGLPQLRFKFLNVEEQEDKLMLAQVDEIMIRRGVYSPDWVAEQRFGIQVPPEEKVGRVFITNSAVVAVRDAVAQSAAQTAQLQATAQQSGATPEPNPANGGENDGESDSGGDTSASQLEAMPAVKGATPDFFTKAGTTQKPRSRKAIEKDIHHTVVTFLREHGRLVAEHIAAYAVALGTLKKSNTNQTGPTNANVPSVANVTMQAQNVVDAVFAQYNIPWDALAQQLVQQIAQAYVAGAYASEGAVAGAFDMAYINPVALQYAQNRAADLIGTGTNPAYSIADSTREWLNSAVTQAIQDGLTPDQLRQSIVENYAFSDNRAWTIARTETAFAYNTGSLGHAQVRGASKVKVFDGDHDEECTEADGQVWTIGYAMSNLIQHPNCVRSFSPDFSDSDPDRTEDDLVA
jgi:hypothetical protein